MSFMDEKKNLKYRLFIKIQKSQSDSPVWTEIVGRETILKYITHLVIFILIFYHT